MTKFEQKLRDVKNNSFTVVISEGIEEILFWHDAKSNAIVVSNKCYFGSGYQYKFNEIDTLINEYSHYEIIK